MIQKRTTILLSAMPRCWKAWCSGARGSSRRRAEQAAVYPGRLDRRILRQSLISAALALGDEMEGGFGRQSRFPMAPQLRVLLTQLEVEDDPELRQFLQLTLDQMARQGLRDQLAGGFFRYTVDPGWQIPHYEKMLYTQALLVRVYLQAARVLHKVAEIVAASVGRDQFTTEYGAVFDGSEEWRAGD